MPNVADLELEKADGLGGTVKLIYGRNAPYYGVLRSETRVLVQFADAPELASEQRKALAPLNPLRGEINGLTEDWRGSADLLGGRKAECFDRRVADALVVAFEGDVPSAQTLLEQIKADVLADRTALARLQYVLAAAIAVFAFVLFANALHSGQQADPDSIAAQTNALCEAARAGSLGALFSIALGIRSRTVLPDLQKLANSLDAVLRVVIGVIAASILIGMLMAKIVQVSVGEAEVTALSWLPIFVFGFLAGFSERLVPDLLSKVATKFDIAAATTVKPAGKPAAPAPPPGDAGGGAGPAAPAPPDPDPLPQEAAHDSCTCDLELTDDETTPDEQLPPASGGVATGGGAG